MELQDQQSAQSFRDWRLELNGGELQRGTGQRVPRRLALNLPSSKPPVRGEFGAVPPLQSLRPSRPQLAGALPHAARGQDSWVLLANGYARNTPAQP